MSIPQRTIERVVALALEEDLGAGDLTTAACIDPQTRGRAELRAREPLVFCGAAVVREVFRQIDADLSLDFDVSDGGKVAVGGRVATVAGLAASILQGERVALNFAQRMSAVATRTAELVAALPAGSRTRIVDTRKTTPGLRAFERHAVRCGGGHNHRENLGSAVLIKDNHIAACGGVAEAVRAARAYAPHTSRITCEVGSTSELDEALAAGADVVMLDNFEDAALPAAVARIAGRALVEVSGRITLARVAEIARAGVDVISVGALTHSAGSIDLGLDWT
ncbi:MAG TPA: carboxylating nicotinate-nucleotide diphosphorylase [Polyangiales bacterium]|nr:carboxylating nicotinate-nucleotide diphosphorylase [Polyangiales bacterium]